MSEFFEKDASKSLKKMFVFGFDPYSNEPHSNIEHKFVLTGQMRRSVPPHARCSSALGACVWFYNYELNQTDARLECEHTGGTLAVLDTRELFDFAVSVINEFGLVPFCQHEHHFVSQGADAVEICPERKPTTLDSKICFVEDNCSSKESCSLSAVVLVAQTTNCTQTDAVVI